MKNSIPLLLQLGCLLALAVFSGCASSDIPEGECEFTSECPLNFVCRNYQCVSEGQDGATCGPNERLVDGRCEPINCACRSDADCPGERCVDCACYPRACEDGQTRDCNTACGGKQDCRNGVWQPCRQPEVERCGDNIDNDCNGQTDEGCVCVENEERPCSNSCGGGLEVCTNGMFTGCTAPAPRQEICGNGVDENCDGQLDDGCACTEVGATRECATACGQGTETCNGETFAGCTAQAPQDEFCDGQDNDCNGEIDDNLTRDCSNACGAGVESCTNGQWLGCDAPDTCPCTDGQIDQQVCSLLGSTPCGSRSRTCNGEIWGEWSQCEARADACEPGTIIVSNCSTGGCGQERRVCSDSCEWSVSPCSGSGECVPGERRESPEANLCLGSPELCNDQCTWVSDASPGSDEDSCTIPGEEQTTECGRCGVKTRTCLPCYRWSDWSGCNNEPADACVPNQEELQACGQNCQTQRRVCQADCTWSEFGECSAGGECNPNDTRSETCGLCGSKQQTCNNDCIWEDTSTCGGQGVCDPNEPNPAGGTSRCDDALGSVGQCASGTTSRTCDPNTCTWSEWGECGRDPDPEVCGNSIDENCDGVVERNPDQFEPNDQCSTCTLLSSDADPVGEIEARIDQRGDVDYYCFWADDGPSVPFLFDEDIEIRLTSIPDNADYDVYLYQGTGSNASQQRANAIDNCQNEVFLNERDSEGRLVEGFNTGNDDEYIKWEERIPGGDSGFYIIKVEGVYGHSCTEEYTLEYDGLR